MQTGAVLFYGLPTSSRYVAKLKNVSALRKKPPETFCRQLKRKARPSACPSAFSANDRLLGVEAGSTERFSERQAAQLRSVTHLD